MAERIEIPIYPGSTLAFSQSVSARGGGGGMAQNFATVDTAEAVVAFFEGRLGPPTSDAAAGSAFWRFDKPSDTLRGGQRLEVWPVTGPYPFRGAHGSAVPPDAQSIIHKSYAYAPASV